MMLQPPEITTGYVRGCRSSSLPKRDRGIGDGGISEIRTVWRILLQIAIVISLVELPITVALAPAVQAFPLPVEAAVEALVLAAISTPIIFTWVIKPFIVSRDEATHLAQRDHLTLVSNRLFLAEQLKRCGEACAQRGTYGALLFIDLDGFKRVNDEHGHYAGDAVLVAAANRMQSATRAQDIIFRLGGDEFMVLLCPSEGNANSVLDTSRKIAERFRELLREPYLVGGKVLQVDASIGVRLLDGENMDPDEVMRDADAAMYQAKAGCGGRVLVFGQ